MSPDTETKRFVGILTKDGGTLHLKPLNKKDRKSSFPLNSKDLMGATEGSIIVADRSTAGGLETELKVKRVLGTKDTPGIFTLISLYELGLSEEFSQAALKQASGMTVPELGDREDLRSIPLVTVDGPTSRDFDDAIFAEDTPDGGKHLIVAIADVSWYVRPGDDLDQEALKRGNSTYLPDRAVPMLPEALSNGLCSLKPNEDRACLAAHLWIDKDGNLTGKKVTRALIKSAARLTYEQLQAARDGKPDAVTKPLMDTVVNPLYEAYDILKKASKARGTLDLSSPEYVTEVDAKGKAVNIALEDDSTSHDVIAEFMILANTATDQLLEEKGEIGVHRVHDLPPENKLASLREYLKPYGLTFPEGPITSPRDFKDLVEKASKMPEGRQIIGAVARAMSKAKYSTANIGHFGLALRIYGHFTSPIRRYADLIQHRKLVKAFNLGAGAITPAQEKNLDKMVEQINKTELLSVKAERAANDRYAADYLSTQIGKEFKGRITGVIGGGVFVRLEGAGAEGMLPASYLPKDHYNFDAAARSLTGAHNGLVFKAGDDISVRVKQADGLTGSVLLAPANDNKASAPGQQNTHQNKPQNNKQSGGKKRNKNSGYRPR